MRLAFAALILLSLTPPLASAQWVPGRLSTGTRVRITAPVASEKPVTGSFLSAERDTVRIATAGGGLQLSIPFAAVERLQVGEGRARGKWALGGAGVGLLVGGLIGGMAGGHNDNTGSGSAMGSLLGIILGPPTGAVLGALIAPERWRDQLVTSLR